MSIFKRPKLTREQKLAKLTAAQRTQLAEIEDQAFADFTGDWNELESALGMLRTGHHVGWKVLYIVHSKKTIRNYERILTGLSKNPVVIRDLFPPTGPSSYRSFAFRVADAASNFWKVVSGDAPEKIDREKRQQIEA